MSSQSGQPHSRWPECAGSRSAEVEMGERAVRHQQGGARTSETSAHDSRARQHHSIERDAATPRARSEFCCARTGWAQNAGAWVRIQKTLWHIKLNALTTHGACVADNYRWGMSPLTPQAPLRRPRPIYPPPPSAAPLGPYDQSSTNAGACCLRARARAIPHRCSSSASTRGCAARRARSCPPARVRRRP